MAFFKKTEFTSQKNTVIQVLVKKVAKIKMLQNENFFCNNMTPLPGQAIKSGFSTPSKIRLAGAQLSLNKTFLFSKINPDKEPQFRWSAVCLQNTI
jgi:hypothetical protein